MRLKKKTKNIVWKYPYSIERDYTLQMIKLVRVWENAVKITLFPHLPEIIQQAKYENGEFFFQRKDDWSNELDRAMESLSLSISFNESLAENRLRFTAHKVSQYNVEQWFAITNKLIGIPLYQTEAFLTPLTNIFVRNNIELIKSMQQDTLKQIRLTVSQGIQQGLRVETIQKQIINGTEIQKGIFKKLKTRAALIARDQTAKLNGQLTKRRQTSVGISRYTWQTVIDERVRITHRAMEGLLCRWDDSSLYSIDGGETWNNRATIGGILLHPGEDYQCRCFASPDFDTLDLGAI